MRKCLGGQRFTLFGELDRDGRGATRHRPSCGEEQCCRYELRPDQSRIPLPANRWPDRLVVAASSKAASTAPIRRSELNKVAIQIASALVAEQDDTWVGS